MPAEFPSMLFVASFRVIAAPIKAGFFASKKVEQESEFSQTVVGWGAWPSLSNKHMCFIFTFKVKHFLWLFSFLKHDFLFK